MDEAAATKAAHGAKMAAGRARAERAALRWTVKPGDPDRERRLQAQLDALDGAMKRLRPLIGKLVWEPVSDATETELRSASAACQYERRQLKKMRRP